MAGFLPGIANSANPNQFFTGPLVGGKLRIYISGTSTPVTAYSDLALTDALPWPLLTDSAGRLPFFFLADGVYKVRLSSADGSYVAYDIDEIATVRQAAPTDVDPGDEVVASNGYQTGDYDWKPYNGTRDGWVRSNGGTIGSATSSATERANADCEDLFIELWTKYNNTQCPVEGGRGASAALDWAANKTIATFDMRCKGIIGCDGMGGTALGTLTGVPIVSGSLSSAGSVVGAPFHVLKSFELARVTPVFTGSNGPISISLPGVVSSPGGGYASDAGAGGNGYALNNLLIGTTGTGNFTPTGVVSGFGNDSPHNNTQLSVTVTWYVKL